MPALNEERLRNIILSEAYREVQLKEGQKDITVPIAQAVMRSIAVNAVRGDQRSQKMFTDLVNTTEAKNKKLHDEFLETMMDYKLGWEAQIDHYKQQGAKPPEPVPHPDHIKIDMATGQVRITGPFTKEEKERWDLLRKRKEYPCRRLLVQHCAALLYMRALQGCRGFPGRLGLVLHA